MSPLPSRSLRLCVVLCWGGGVSLCVPPCVSAAAPLGVITPLRVSHCTCGGTRRSFRGMIDLLSYTTMDLHAAWPVAGCRSSSRLLGVCVSSSSSNVMSGSRQLRGTLFLVVASRRLSGCAAVPSSITVFRAPDVAWPAAARGEVEPGDGYPGSPPLRVRPQ